jgi:predicted transcriptional regulator of viral defense system
MRNTKYPLTELIMASVSKLPYFTVENAKLLPVLPYYLKIALSRFSKRTVIIRLKKGFYASRQFAETAKKENTFSQFLEFIATKLYAPSYLSLEYVLYENNILTDVPQHFTLITKNKTATFSNEFGTFIYHKIKDTLYDGYYSKRTGDFLISKASKSKALFDYIYLRRNILMNEEMINALRLNLDNFTKTDKARLLSYINAEGSKKLRFIYSCLFRK